MKLSAKGKFHKSQTKLMDEAREESDRDAWLCRFGRVKGSAPRDLFEGAALLVPERLELEVENWVQTVERYGSIYHRVAGKVENLKRKALELGQRWLSGEGKSRWVFRRKARGGQPADVGAV